MHGLDIRVLAGAGRRRLGLKMSYAGITKGFTALGAVMMLAATRAGTADALRRELSRQPAEPAGLARAGGPGDDRRPIAGWPRWRR